MEATGATTIESVRDVRPIQSTDRLAELVVHLTDCPPALAVVAVNEAAAERRLDDTEDRLEVLASALVSVKRGIDLRDGQGTPGRRTTR
jgi:hypothetical protein